jgi:ketosteroid isomerase-like protein
MVVDDGKDWAWDGAPPKDVVLRGGVNYDGRSADEILRDLAAREEIRELIACYAQRASHGVSVADMFTEDGVITLRFPERPVFILVGREAIQGGFEQTMAQSSLPLLPMIHNFVFHIDGDRADALCWSEIRLTEDGERKMCSGYYQDQLIRRADGWKFIVRDLTFREVVPD